MYALPAALILILVPVKVFQIQFSGVPGFENLCLGSGSELAGEGWEWRGTKGFGLPAWLLGNEN